MKTVLMMTISVNGFIARTNDDAPWSDEEFARCEEFARSVGNVVVGRRTYQIMEEAGQVDPSVLTVVLTRDIKEPHDNVVYLSSPEHVIEYLKSKNFEVANIGGGTIVVTQFFSAGLIDEVILDVEPILLDHGIRLNDQSIPDVALEHLKTQQFGDTVRLHYQVKK